MKPNERKHHWPDKQCYYCGEPATCFCDGINHFLVDSKMKILTDNPDAVEYCDRPLCDEHSERMGTTTQSGQVETIDYCPKHLTKEKLGEYPELRTK